MAHNHVYASLRSGTDNVVDLYFPPVRDEAPASGSTSPTMMLTALVPGVSTVYATDFVGGDWNPAARASAFNDQPAPSPAPTTEAQLRALLASTSPEYDTIDLPANTTIILTQPLEITHSVAIDRQQLDLALPAGLDRGLAGERIRRDLRECACVQQHPAHAFGLHDRVRYERPAPVEQPAGCRAGTL